MSNHVKAAAERYKKPPRFLYSAAPAAIISNWTLQGKYARDVTGVGDVGSWWVIQDSIGFVDSFERYVLCFESDIRARNKKKKKTQGISAQAYIFITALSKNLNMWNAQITT